MRRALFAAAAVVALASAGAMAQNTLPNNANDKMSTSTTNPGAMGANPPPARPAPAQNAPVPNAGPRFVQIENSDMLSSNVVELDIYNKQNNKIGKIQDIAFNSSKQFTGYILSVGGFLGMGTHYVAVNPSSLNVAYDAQNRVWRASMNATKAELKAAPEFKYSGQWTASRS